MKVYGMFVCVESSESDASLGEASRNLILKFGGDSCSCVYKCLHVANGKY